MSNVVSHTRLQFRFSWNLVSCCVSRRHGQRSNVLTVFISLSGSNMRPCFAFARRNTRAMIKNGLWLDDSGLARKGSWKWNPAYNWPIQGKECSSDVSSRFFWVERCVTAQKTAARETKFCEDSKKSCNKFIALWSPILERGRKLSKKFIPFWSPIQKIAKKWEISLLLLSGFKLVKITKKRATNSFLSGPKFV